MKNLSSPTYSAMKEVDDLNEEDRAPCIVRSILVDHDVARFKAVGIGLDKDNPQLVNKFGDVDLAKRRNDIVSLKVLPLAGGSGSSENAKPYRPGPASAKKGISISPAIVGSGTSSIPGSGGPRISSDALDRLKKRFHDAMPRDRFARIDIVRFLLSNASTQKLALLRRVGISFDHMAGGFVQGSEAFNEERAKQ